MSLDKIGVKKENVATNKKTQESNSKEVTEYGIQIVKDYKHLPDIKEFENFPEKQMMIKSLDMYTFLMKLVIKDSDFHQIVSRKTGIKTPYLKRSGYSKIAQAFNITTIKLEEEMFEVAGEKHAKCVVRAIVNNLNPEAIKLGIQAVISSGQFSSDEVVTMIEKLGRMRYADGVGIVGMNEIKNDWQRTQHNLRTYAFTRARNRAIADIAGFSIMSAIEISQEIEDEMI